MFFIYKVFNKIKLLGNILSSHLVGYTMYTNLTHYYSLGGVSGLFLVMQIVSGFILSVHYVADSLQAFDVIQHIMREVNFGWLVRYLHIAGASSFFLLIYLHIAKGIYHKSYTVNPLMWVTGFIIYILMMATAFVGYVLPWGQMSLWGATVITNLIGALPWVGILLLNFLWGDFSVENSTLHRFYSLHFLCPFLIVGFVIIHLIVLHGSGGSNPLFATRSKDIITFTPYFINKDAYLFFIVWWLFLFITFFYVKSLGHPDNYIAANPMSTPAHIVPEWYFLSFYAVLRGIPNKLAGFILMFLTMLFVLFFAVSKDRYMLPKDKSTGFKNLIFCTAVFFILMGFGSYPAEGLYVLCNQLFVLWFLVVGVVLITIDSIYIKINFYKIYKFIASRIKLQRIYTKKDWSLFIPRSRGSYTVTPSFRDQFISKSRERYSVVIEEKK